MKDASNQLIRIAHIDEELLFIEGMTLIFSHSPLFDPVIVAHNAPEFLEILASTRSENLPEIILMEIRLESMDGFDLMRTIVRRFPSIPVIVLSSFYNKVLLTHAVKTGAAAFVSKDASLEDLKTTIEQVKKEGSYYTPENNEMLRAFLKGSSKSRYFKSAEKVSRREIEILQLICQEYTNEEIAEKLFLSPRTIESHRQRLCAKTGAKNVVGLVVYAISNEFFTPDLKYH